MSSARDAMLALAGRLEADGNLAGAADVRRDLADLAARAARAARVPEPVRCDGCGQRVGEGRAARYDALGVDWAYCARCTGDWQAWAPPVGSGGSS